MGLGCVKTLFSHSLGQVRNMRQTMMSATGMLGGWASSGRRGPDYWARPRCGVAILQQLSEKCAQQDILVVWELFAVALLCTIEAR